MPDRPKLMHYAEEISYDEFTPIYELPADTTIWRIFNTGEQTIYWSEFEKPPSKGEKSYHTLLPHSAEVPITIPSQIFVKRTDQDSKPRVEILWTRSKDPNDMARVAGGLHIGKQIVTTTSGRGIEAKISGETVTAKISGEAVRVSGETVTAKISGETVIAKTSGQVTEAQLHVKDKTSDSWTPWAQETSGFPNVAIYAYEPLGGAFENPRVDLRNYWYAAISGETVIAKISGESVIAKISGETVRISGGAVVAKISGETVIAKVSGEAQHMYAYGRTGGQWNKVMQQYSGKMDVLMWAHDAAMGQPTYLETDTAGRLLTRVSGDTVIAKISGETVIAKISGETVRISGGAVVAKISGETVIAKISGDTILQKMAHSYTSGVLGADMTIASGATDTVTSPVVVDVGEQDVIAVEARATAGGMAVAGRVIFALQRAMISGDFEGLVSGGYYPCIVYQPAIAGYTRAVTRVPVEGVKYVQIGQVVNEAGVAISGVNATIGVNR